MSKGHHYVVRTKGKCSCGMMKNSLRDLMNHALSKGHKIVRAPRKNGKEVTLAGNNQ